MTEATMTILSTGDLVTDEKVDEYEGAEFDELIEVSGHPSTRVVIEDGSDCVVIDDKVYSIAELLELMEVLPRALRVAIDNT
jgi:translation elongation factor EF-Tu-like GTPase